MLRHLRRSAALLRARAVVQIALGVAVVLSLLSVCCGVGVVTAPWFLCELFAVQLAEARRARVVRTRSWVLAGLLLSGAVVLIGSVFWLTWLGVGSEPSHSAWVTAPGLEELASLPWPSPSRGTWVAGAVAVLAGLIALSFLLPFVYSSPTLIDRGGTLGGAVLASARVVARGGAWFHIRLSLLAHSIQVAPLLLLVAPSTVPIGQGTSATLALSCLPLLALSVPLGQGTIVSAYLDRRGLLADPGPTRIAGRPPRPLVLLWILLALAPLASFAALGGSLARPSRLSPGRLPPSAERLSTMRLSREPAVFRPPGTALGIHASTAQVRVVASDGGGAGSLPLPGAGPLTEVVVGRVGDVYGIEVQRAGERFICVVDGAGVRRGDGLRARLGDRIPWWALLAMLAALFATASLLLPVLALLGDVRRAYALPAGERAAPRALSSLRRSAIRRASLFAIPLIPLSALSLYFGLRAVF